MNYREIKLSFLMDAEKGTTTRCLIVRVLDDGRTFGIQVAPEMAAAIEALNDVDKRDGSVLAMFVRALRVAQTNPIAAVLGQEGTTRGWCATIFFERGSEIVTGTFPAGFGVVLAGISGAPAYMSEYMYVLLDLAERMPGQQVGNGALGMN